MGGRRSLAPKEADELGPDAVGHEDELGPDAAGNEDELSGPDIAGEDVLGDQDAGDKDILRSEDQRGTAWSTSRCSAVTEGTSITQSL